MRTVLRLLDPRPVFERLLHPARRTLARRRLARTPRPPKIFFVCKGNICRSPYAAAVVRRASAEGRWTTTSVGSAGFLSAGRPAPPHAIEVAARRGIDLVSHVSKLVDAEILEPESCVVVMEPEQRELLVDLFGCSSGRVFVLGDFDPLPIERRVIEDPWSQGETAFERSYERIDRCVGALVQSLKA